MLGLLFALHLGLVEREVASIDFPIGNVVLIWLLALSRRRNLGGRLDAFLAF